MAASSGRLTLDLVAKIGNFTEPMAQAERQAKDSSNSIADSFSVASVATKALGVAVAGISAGGMIAFANQAIDTGSEIKKFSQLANASMHEFQYYAKGAETAGISMESFADKMKDMQDRIGDFHQTGGGPLVDFFDNIAPRVGVTIQQFQKLSGPAALQLYHDSLQKVNVTQNDYKFYMEAIISDSSLLRPLLKNGGEGFKKWGDAAERANAIMSDEMIETLAIAKENVQLLNLQWEGLQATLVNNVVPVVQTVVANMDAITNTMIIGGAFITGAYIPALISSTAAGYAKAKQIVEQTAIQYAAINAERAAAASSLAQAEAQLVNTQSTLAALAAEKALEVQRMQAQINSAGRAASATRMAQLRQIEVQVTAELTAAETALAAARARTTAATAASVGVGRATLGILGGPVGIGVTLAVVAAGYLLMSDGAEKATASINIQGQSVAELVKKYRELNTLQRDSEVKALADQVEELSLKYRVASSDLYSFMEALPISDEKIATFRKLNSQLSQGRISSNEYYEAVKAVNILTDDQIDKVNRLITAYDEKKAALNQGKAAQDALKTAISKTSEKTQENTRHNQENTKSITDRASAIANLTQKQRAVVKGIDSEIAREKYIAANMKNGWSRERAGYFADKREESGMAFTETASKVWFLQVEEGYKLSQQTKAREESEKKIAEVKQKQVESQKKMNELVGASALSGLRIKSGESVAGGKVRAYTADFAQLSQQALGSSLNRFTAFNDLYHKGTNSKHATGNAFDFTIADASKSTQAVKQLEDVAKRYGYVVKVWDEYRNPSSRATGGHLHVSVLGFKGTAEAAKQAQDELSLVTQTNEEAKRIQEESQRAQQSVIQNYLTEREKLELDHVGKLKAINDAFAGDDSAIKKYTEMQSAAYQKDIAEYQEAQKQKELSDKKQLLEASRNWMTAGDYAREYYALVREEILNTAEYSPGMKEALLQQSVSQQNFEQSSERDQAISDYRDVMGYEENPLEQQFKVLQKMRELDLLNEEAYQNAKLELQAKSTAGYMEGMLGGFASLVDENSKTYAVLFAAQKAFAVAQAMLNIPAAYSKAYDAVVGTPYIGPYIAPAVGAAAAALQVAQAASIKGVGFAAGGFTGYGGKYEPAGIVHKGEGVLTQEEIAALGGPAGFYALRESIKNGFSDGGLVLDAPKVLNPNQNKDLTNYLSQAQSNSSQSQPIDNQIRVAIFDDRADMMNQMYGREGEKVVMYHLKRNGMLKA